MPADHPLTKSAAECRQLLTDQQITPDGPGTILKDLQVVMDCIGAEGVRTQSKRGNLPSALLPELNARLSQPIELHLERPLLRDYPNIAGLYLLLRVLELARVDGPKLRIDEAQRTAWTALNPAEQYFALLDAWLLKADAQVLGGEKQRPRGDSSDRLWFLVRNLGPRFKTFEEWVHTYWSGLSGGVSTWNILLMQQLGLIEVVPRPLNKRSKGCSLRGWMMWQARRTPWGDAVAWAILERMAAEEGDVDDMRFEQSPGTEDVGMVLSVFQPHFPEYQTVFGPPAPEVHPGVYVFKVGYHRRYGPAEVWRRLAVPDSATLYDLCGAVLEAFKFWDDDHLHEFQYRDRTGRPRVFGHPYMDEGPSSDGVTLGETGLPEKQDLDFTFDFGSTWKFVLRLEQIAPPDPHLNSIKVVESHGTPLKQYGELE